MTTHPNPRHFAADKVSPRARSLQGDSNLTYRQETRIRTMNKRRAKARYGHGHILTPVETAELHCEVARMATSEFRCPVTPEQVKLAVKSSRHPPERRRNWPVDADEDAYAFISYVAEALGISRKAALNMMADHFRCWWEQDGISRFGH